MFTTAEELIQCLSDDLCVEHNLIIEEIKKSSSLKGYFLDVVEDFSEYETLRDVLAEKF